MKTGYSSVEVLDTGLDSALADLIRDSQASQLLIAAPFITDRGVDIIAESLNKRSRRAPKVRLLVITKFDLLDFVCGASDLKAIRRVYKLAEKECKACLKNAAVYDLNSLHAKLFLTNQQAIVGSANLTASALCGGNTEICLRVSEPAIRRSLKQAFIHLANQASIVDEDFLQSKEKLVNSRSVQEEIGKYNAMRRRLVEFHSASRLCRLPVQQETRLKEADYYGQMQAYLKWIQQGNGHRTRAGLTRRIAKTLNNQQNVQNQPLAALRVEFLKSIGVIDFPTTQTVKVTTLGKKVIESKTPERTKEIIFKRILKWCEIEHHDRILRDLIRPFEGPDTSHTIKSLMETMGVSNVNKGDYKAFVEITSPARGWLQSLGVLKLEENTIPYRYSRGATFPIGNNNFDVRMNTLVGIEDDLQWLQLEE